MKALIDRINQEKILQTECWDDQTFTNEIDSELEGLEIVESGLDVDKHRWYETSVTVYRKGDEFMGIRFITDQFSEQSSMSDHFWTITAFSMKAIQTTTYIKA